jgi:LysR family transcriptional regulator, transcription activator of glutamate synthase operon
VSPKPRLADRRRVTVTDLDQEELVTVPTGFGFRALVNELYAAEDLLPRVSFESEDLATVEGLAGAGLGVAILPDQQAGVSTVAVPLSAPGAERVAGLTWRTDRDLAPPAARFVAFVRSLAHDTLDRAEAGNAPTERDEGISPSGGNRQ